MRLLGVISSSISKVATLIDNFTRTTSGSLGGTWSNIIGTWSANGSKAQNDTVSSNVGLTAATAGGTDPVFTADVDADNVGVAFWVTDSNNYWAASVNQAIITNYTYGSSCAAYSSQGYNYTYSCTGYALLTGYTRYGATYASASQVCTSSTRYGCSAYAWAVCTSYGRYGACASYGAASGTQTCVTTSSYANSYQSVCNSYQQVITNTTYSGGTRTFNLVKKVSGTVSTVFSKVITAGISSYKIISTTSGWLWVKAFPSSGQSGTETIDYLSQPSSPVKGTKHGLYIDLSGYVQTKTADNVSIAGSSSSDVYVGTATVSGGTLTSDDAYYYRTFTGNGTLSVTGGDLKCDILMGAGGGGGDNGGSGGGSYNPNYILSSGSSYSFVIGAAGNNTTGIGISCYAGGTGGTRPGGNGGSGGGGAIPAGCPGSAVAGGSATQASGADAIATPLSSLGVLAVTQALTNTYGTSAAAAGYGYAGGHATGSSNHCGAGGGGLTGVGTNSYNGSTDTYPGNGGPGYLLSWNNTHYGAGGSGSNHAKNRYGTNGTGWSASGYGMGGWSHPQSSQSQESGTQGIVIVRSYDI